MYRRSRSTITNINAAVWLIGLGILWLTNLWWPGILILAGISMLIQVLVSNAAKEAPTVLPPSPTPPAQPAPETKTDTWDEEKTETPPFLQPQETIGNEALLPKACPACGGPVAENAHKVEWMGEHTARCPFCHTVLNV